MKSNEKFPKSVLFFSTAQRVQFKVLMVHSFCVARATCVDFLYEFRNFYTKATNSVEPPSHQPKPTHYIGLCCCLVHVLKECLNMFQNMQPGRTKSSKVREPMD